MGPGWGGVGEAGVRASRGSGRSLGGCRCLGRPLLPASSLPVVPGSSVSMSPRGRRVDPTTPCDGFHENQWVLWLVCWWHTLVIPAGRRHLSSPENCLSELPSVVSRSDSALSRWSSQVQPQRTRAKPPPDLTPSPAALQARN